MWVGLHLFFRVLGDHICKNIQTVLQQTALQADENCGLSECPDDNPLV